MGDNQMTVFRERRKKVLALAAGKQVVAMTPVNLFYLTDFFGSGAGIVLSDKTVVVTSPLEAARAGEVGKEVEVVVAKKQKEDLRVLMSRLERRLVYVDKDDEVRGSNLFKMKQHLFLEARRVKDETEVQRIRGASMRLDKIFDALPSLLKPGRTEWEVAADVMKLATEQGLTPSGSDSALSPTIIGSGENGALPHSELTERKLRKGDFVVADIFFRYKGYNSDETRTFCVGTATSTMKKHYEAVREAQQYALDFAKAGRACEDVNAAAVKVLAEHGVEKYLNHSIGHGVGIDIHELPNIRKGNKLKLMTNDVITDEPGIYLKGKYGIRIEDTLRVGKRADVLTGYTKDLVTCG
jgi:Xaa-Pro aminopeptidase/Xaa-Pro dipeptidase